MAENQPGVLKQRPNRVLNFTSMNDDTAPLYQNPSWSTGETTLDPSVLVQELNNIDMQRSSSERQVATLALQLSSQSTQFSPYDDLENPFVGTKDESTLNPRSPAFKASDWMKNLLALTLRDPIRYPERAAGVSFKGLNVHGYGSPTDYQKDVFNSLLQAGQMVRQVFGGGKQKLQILRDFDGLVKSGEMLMVLGRPGSGCSTLLKTLAGEMNGIYMDDDSHLNYQGIPAQQLRNQFRGEAIYTAENDVHFPQLTVAQTLKFAALARCPRNRIAGVNKEQYAEHMRDAVMAMLGLSHTANTQVGNDLIRGVSGGERKRVSIAEATLSGSPIQCWDNSTRGLDSANALEFCKTLNLMTEYAGATVAVAIYQASQSAYDVFDKVIVLYEGRQIYFGKTNHAKQFFIDMGFECPDRQTTADFLTSITSPSERIVRPGYEDQVPQTPDEFAEAWKGSKERARLLRDIERYEKSYPLGGQSVENFLEARRAMQAKSQRIKSPYTISLMEQINLCMVRGFQRLKGDASLTMSMLIGNFIMALIIGSVFYNLENDTSSFYGRGALLFFAVLLNAFSSALEILTLYAQRPIVEKQARYAMYHPFAESVSSIICDMPYKVLNAIIFNITLYFMTNLRREPAAFFIFLLFSFVTTMTMSMIFRTMAATSRSLAQALVPAAILMLGLVTYTGFTIPTRNMLGWSRWMNYINPIAYGFESLMVNEFKDRSFKCTDSGFVPANLPRYVGVPLANKICSTVGSTPGSDKVQGTAFLEQSYHYYPGHEWRNLGIMFAFMIFFTATHLIAAEYISESKSKGEVLIFRRGQAPRKIEDDIEMSNRATSPTRMADADAKKATGTIMKQEAVFHWQDVCYDIKIKNEQRRILDHVDGWVMPGTCTALMGVSGAGKTTLLDVLATRVTTGVVTGEMLVDGRLRDQSFQRKTGYVQQQDLHLHTTTVREALRFSAVLRQPSHFSYKEKVDYVEEVIALLGMESYADAVVGVPGEGLNVEQRKRLTIGVELAAKPQLLLFLDEPTSGLDSQTSWSILDLIEKLANHGQAILCTIHQPSAMLFQRFDRLLFLAKGGKTVYFGEIGEHSSTLANYFEKNGAPELPHDANPAEWMLEVIGAAPGSHSEIDWPAVWRDSPEREEVRNTLAEMKSTLSQKSEDTSDPNSYNEFAAPFTVQLKECVMRVFSQYWRSPVYIYSKASLCVLTALYIGFSFYKAENSKQGLQNQMFSIFMLLTIFINLVQQIMPNFCTQRSLYEARERPSKTYSWQAFMTANIIVELPWNALMAVFMFLCWYFPIGLYRNAEPTDSVNERGGLMFLLILSFLLFTSTFAHMIIAGIEQAETGGNIAQLLFSLCLIFCGVLVQPNALPRFWIFMYRVSPFTYLVSAMLSTGVSGASATCDPIEYLHFAPLGNQTCASYMRDYMTYFGGYLEHPAATDECSYCPVAQTDVFLLSVSSQYKDAWRNFGLMWVFIIFNVCAAVLIYWLARVPKKQK